MSLPPAPAEPVVAAEAADRLGGAGAGEHIVAGGADDLAPGRDRGVKGELVGADVGAVAAGGIGEVGLVDRARLAALVGGEAVREPGVDRGTGGTQRVGLRRAAVAAEQTQLRVGVLDVCRLVELGVRPVGEIVAAGDDRAGGEEGGMPGNATKLGELPLLSATSVFCAVRVAPLPARIDTPLATSLPATVTERRVIEPNPFATAKFPAFPLIVEFVIEPEIMPTTSPAWCYR